MLHISRTASVWAYQPFQLTGNEAPTLRRKSLACPQDNGTFVKPLRQAFVKNPRLMPMTRIALTLLAGWAGHGDPIKTTVGIIAKHLGRSRRQVFRYLQDAAEEGYLWYSKTKDRIGRYTGICVRLNFAAIRYEKRKKPAETAEKLEVTEESDTKTTDSLFKKIDVEFERRIAAVCLRNGIDPPSSIGR